MSYCPGLSLFRDFLLLTTKYEPGKVLQDLFREEAAPGGANKTSMISGGTVALAEKLKSEQGWDGASILAAPVLVVESGVVADSTWVVLGPVKAITFAANALWAEAAKELRVIIELGDLYLHLHGLQPLLLAGQGRARGHLPPPDSDDIKRALLSFMRRSIAAAIVTAAASIETRVRAVMGEWGVKPMNPAHVFQLDGVVDNT